MTDNIHAALSPLFIISYMFGARIMEFSAGPKLWLSLLYILLLWLVYCLLLAYTAFYYVSTYSIIYHVCFQLDILAAISSTIFGLYYNKKFKNCLRKLNIVDDSLEKLGTITDYQKLYTKVLLVVFGWLLFFMWKTFFNGIWFMDWCEPMKAYYVSFIIHYCTCLNLINDLIIAIILGYIELKFDQINDYLRKSERDNEHETSPAWNDFLLHHPRQTVYSKSVNREYVTWIVIHIHLELRRISRELDSIFGLQMTPRMGIYFAYIALSLREIFNLMLINNYVSRSVLFFFLILITFCSHIFRLFLINYKFERVNVKANATGDLINRMSYCSYDIVVRENILQLVLQITQAPVRFYGLGLFQFGLKFLHVFCSSVATVIVILVQSHINK